MTGLIPIKYTPITQGVQYIGFYVPMDGRRIIVRKTSTDVDTTFEYSVPYVAEQDFLAAWQALGTLTYSSKADVEANLAPLFSAFGGTPTVVQMTPSDKLTPQHVIVDNRADVQRMQIAGADAPLPVTVSGTQAVSLAAPAHVIVDNQPGGGATAAAQATAQASFDALNATLATRTKPTDTQKVDGSAVTQPVSAAALPLPAGAATAANQATANAALAAIQAAAQAPAATVARTRYAGLSAAASQGLASIKTGATAVYEIHASSASSATRVLAFYNKATAPAAGDTPALSFVLPPGASYRYSLDGAADQFPLGLAYSISTSQGVLAILSGVSLTALAAGEVFFVVHYV